MTFRPLLILPLVAALVAPLPSLAHSKLATTVPADDSTVAGPVTSLAFSFGEKVESNFATVKLTKDGAAVEATPDVVLSKDGTTLTFDGLSLGAGAWVAAWSIVSADGHRVDGELEFTVTP